VIKRFVGAVVVACVLLGVAASGYLWLNPRCGAGVAGELLPNAAMASDGDNDGIPDGWSAAVKGPARQVTSTVTGEGFAMLLIGIGNSLQTPEALVVAGSDYCLVAQALTDRGSEPTYGPTALQLRFHWLDTFGNPVGEHVSAWLPVKTPVGGGWSQLRVAARAPERAARLYVSMHPASDDPIYIDEVGLRRGGGARLIDTASAAPAAPPADAIRVAPWPDGKRAALSFSFDWETTMGGLIHSRSAGDPNVDDDPIQRGLRMRQGVTETLRIFRPYGIRATYYATGYNFLTGNRERQTFMGDPIYSWATPANRWRRDWSRTRWFGDDPYTDHQDAASQGAAWYFGDLIPLLQAEGQDIQSHTFAHFYGGFVTPDDWYADLRAWQSVAAPHGVAGPTSIAFPWSSSGGMSYAAWDTLARLGIRSATRLSDQAQYQLFTYIDDVPVDPRCKGLPGHEQIIVCPDVYLTPGAREAKVLQAIAAAIAMGGALDVWAHTEEVTSPEQIATWQRVVEVAGTNPHLWVAPLREIADWQRAVGEVRVRSVTPGNPYRVVLANEGAGLPLTGVTVEFPFRVARSHVITSDGQMLATNDTPAGATQVVLPPFEAGQTLELLLWPA
jgi:peptidoglycan/xylan/chitin deacetylase (PgdA/CDA1 family)